MKEQKVIITDSAYDINDCINMGWIVVSVTAQHVAIGNSGNSYSTEKVLGKFCFVIEKQ